MKYLNREAFNVNVGGEAYAVGWERIFGSTSKCKICDGTGKVTTTILYSPKPVSVLCATCNGIGKLNDGR